MTPRALLRELEAELDAVSEAHEQKNRGDFQAMYCAGRSLSLKEDRAFSCGWDWAFETVRAWLRKKANAAPDATARTRALARAFLAGEHRP